jgi:hypothetical protein
VEVIAYAMRTMRLEMGETLQLYDHEYEGCGRHFIAAAQRAVEVVRVVDEVIEPRKTSGDRSAHAMIIRLADEIRQEVEYHCGVFIVSAASDEQKSSGRPTMSAS